MHFPSFSVTWPSLIHHDWPPEFLVWLPNFSSLYPHLVVIPYSSQWYVFFKHVFIISTVLKILLIALRLIKNYLTRPIEVYVVWTFMPFQTGALFLLKTHWASSSFPSHVQVPSLNLYTHNNTLILSLQSHFFQKAFFSEGIFFPLDYFLKICLLVWLST